jgi:hypothetical protein
MLVAGARKSVLSIINGGGKWVELSIEADPISCGDGSPDHLAGKAAEFITTDRILEDHPGRATR